MMKICNDCIHCDICDFSSGPDESACAHFEDKSQFVRLVVARKIRHIPDKEIMKSFHDLGLGKGMSENSIFWTCSNCGMWVSLAHQYCSSCGAKFEDNRRVDG